MQVLHLLSLLLIGITWLAAWWIGCRFVRASGVGVRADTVALGSIIPTAGLLFCVHVIAVVALFTGVGLVTPESVAALFAGLTWFGHRKTSQHRMVVALPNGGRHFDVSVFQRLQRLWWLPLLVVTGMYAVFLLDALTRYPSGSDAVTYHLPAAVGWMQNRSIDLIYGLMAWSLPENGMIVPFLLSFARLETLITVAHLPKAILLALAIYGLSRTVGVSARGAIIAACIALSVPIIVFQSFSDYIDLYGTSSWLCALLALTWATRVDGRDQQRCLMLLAGLSAGIALGSKTIYFVLVFLLLIVVGMVNHLGSRRAGTIEPRPSGSGEPAPTKACSSKPTAPWRHVLQFGLASLVCSGFWLVRGAVQAGNPVYPLAVTVGGAKLLPGFQADEIFPTRSFSTKIQRWWDYPWREHKINRAGYNYGVNNGLGTAFATFVLVGFLAGVIGCVRRRPRDAIAKWQAVFVCLALCGGVLFLTIFRETLRFILPLVLLTIPVAALMIDRLMVSFPKATLALLTVSLAVTASIATLRPAKFFLGRVRDGVWSRAAFYEMPPLVDELPAGTRVLNLVANEATYGLLGKHLTNVVITPIHWRFLTQGKGISAETLREHRIDYVCTVEPWPSEWPDDLPLEPAGDNTTMRMAPTTQARRLYRVRAPHSAHGFGLVGPVMSFNDFEYDPTQPGAARGRRQLGPM